ncbi:MAG: hypothetical protein HDQ89_05365 [Desulfovibrio sp.]|nr:hypothetical protein [Desulfovibrio sp.]
MAEILLAGGISVPAPPTQSKAIAGPHCAIHLHPLLIHLNAESPAQSRNAPGFGCLPQQALFFPPVIELLHCTPETFQKNTVP